MAKPADTHDPPRNPAILENILQELMGLTEGGTNAPRRDQIRLLLRIVTGSYLGSELRPTASKLVMISEGLHRMDRGRGLLNQAALKLNPGIKVPPFTHPGNTEA